MSVRPSVYMFLYIFLWGLRPNDRRRARSGQLGALRHTCRRPALILFPVNPLDPGRGAMVHLSALPDETRAWSSLCDEQGPWEVRVAPWAQ